MQTGKVKVDRLPVLVESDAFYLNIGTLRSSHETPQGKRPVIVFDGTNDVEVCELVGDCELMDWCVLVLSLPDLDHIPLDEVEQLFCVDRHLAYEWSGSRWVATQDLVDAVRHFVCDDRWGTVVAEGA